MIYHNKSIQFVSSAVICSRPTVQNTGIDVESIIKIAPERRTAAKVRGKHCIVPRLVLSVCADSWFAVLGLVEGVRRAGRLILLVNGLVVVSASRHRGETKVNVVISSTFAVHLVDKEAGHRLEQQAEDGHSCAEAKYVPSPVCCEVIQRVIDPEMDDVSQYRHDHPHQEHEHSIDRVPLCNGPDPNS